MMGLKTKLLRVFHRMKVSQKLMLISVFFMIPDTVLLCLFLISINDNIHFARWEKLGNQYQRPLEELLQYLPEYCEAGRNSAQDPEMTSQRRREIEARIDGAFSRLLQVDASIGGDLQFTDDGLAKRNRSHCRAQTIRREWLEMKSQGAKLSAREVAAREAHLITDVRTMITHAGDNSNLILDPDLDSYYLMDVTLLGLPEMQDRLAQVTAQGGELLRGGGLSAENRSRMLVHAALLQQSDLDRISQSARNALNEDANFYGVSAAFQTRLPAALEDFTVSAEEFIRLTTLLGGQNESGLTADQYLASGQKARAASFALWKIASEELDTLLDARIHHYWMRRARSLSITALALLAAAGFVTFITRSISRPLQLQASELRQSNDALKKEIAERERAEEALREAEEKYRGIFENSVEGIFQTSPEGRYLVANPTLARIYGYASVAELQAEVTDIGARLYADPRRRTDFQKKIAQEGHVERFESEIFRKDGSKLWISENARAVCDERGTLRCYEGTVQDITARKRSEEALEQAQKDLLEASRLAGKAEVATGILHNVGNVLNSVNVSANFIADTLRKSKIPKLGRVAALLSEHAGNLGQYVTEDAKGRQLPGYIGDLATHLAGEQEALEAKAEQLKKHLDHMKQIVAMQQTYAKLGGFAEMVKVDDIIEDAVRMNAAGLSRNAVEVVRELEPMPPLSLDKHKALQILVNLIRNAEHACVTSNRPDRRISIRAENDGGAVRISVADNGVGIPAENMVRIFSHGFTTRRDGHGFGLHSGALAAKEIGGALRAHSEGPGLGATFTLELPIEKS